MKTLIKISLILVLALCSGSAISQVLINTTGGQPDGSAMLDIQSTGKGLLIPRMTTAQMNAIPNPAEGLLVYNTSEKCIYSYTGSAWVQLKAGSATKISDLDGNTGIDAEKFPNDNILHFSNSGVEFLTMVQGRMNVLNTGNSVFLGDMAGLSEDLNNRWNTFVGSSAGTSTTTGGSNVAIGSMSLQSNISGSNNTAIGVGASPYSLGNDNTALGNLAGFSNIYGTQNTLIGSKSNVASSNLNNTIALGYNATANSSNEIRLGTNSHTSLYAEAAKNSTTGNPPNLAIDGVTGQIMKSTATVVSGTGAPEKVVFWGTDGHLGASGMFHWDITNLRLGIGTSTPHHSLEVNGRISAANGTAGSPGYVFGDGTDNTGMFKPATAALAFATNGAETARFDGTGRLGIGTTAPSSSAQVEIASTTKGVLIPRVTKGQRDAIGLPAEGLMVFCTNCGTNGSLSIYSNGAWRTFSECSLAAPAPGVNNTAYPGQIVWKWLASPGASGYKWNTTSDYESATDMGTGLMKTETGAVCNTGYTRYIWAYNSCGVSATTTLFAAMPAAGPASPSIGFYIPTSVSILWNWEYIPEATGYKWNTDNNLATATDMGTASAKSETGLTCGTEYTRYVWAYNGCGYSAPFSMTQSTNTCFTCGTPVTINHSVSGGVAPVNKTVTYETVTNIPGEASKCWITRNLGASQQAVLDADTSEASAGWYWQFNLKQGYKHDGTTRTPNTGWITVNMGNPEWTAANDPCTLELGAGWRIPTKVEWENISYAGSWTLWFDPWASTLKIHAAGHLLNDNGTLAERGNAGYYWSSSSDLIESANCFMFSFLDNVNPNYSMMKSEGMPLRCIRD